jgi:hypothetical protein
MMRVKITPKSVNFTHQFGVNNLFHLQNRGISRFCGLARASLKHSGDNMKRIFNRTRFLAASLGIALASVTGVFAQTVTFATNDYVVGVQPTAVVAADVFGTGRPAIITANMSVNTLTVLGNFGNGTFASKATYKVSNFPRAIVAADWNGDGKIDLASVGSLTTTILTNYNSGLFASNATINAGGNCGIAFYLNGSGAPDLLIGGNTTVSLFTNNDTGGLGLNSTLPVPGSVTSMAASDVNLDGTLDLLVANGRNVTVFTNTGSGSLVSNATYTVSPFLQGIAVADINNDGYPDLIGNRPAGFPTSALSIWTNNGSGVFGSNTVLAIGRGGSSIIAADFNGDGFIDLAALDTSDRPGIVSIVTNSSSGFGNYSTNVAGVEPPAMAMADFNGDSKPDLVLANTGTSVTVMLNSTVFASPPLNIVSGSGGQSVLYWKSPAPNSVLQATTNLVNPNWVDVTGGQPIQGVTLSNAAPALFFRLISQ